jgi:hypothetical protein
LTAILVFTSGCADNRSVTGLRPNTTSISASTFPNLSSVEFFPSSVGGGGSVTGRVTLDGPAFDGARVLLSSSHPDVVQVPDEVVVSLNTSSKDFPVTTSAVSSNVTATITATACCGSQGTATGTLTVTTDAPPAADVVRIVRADFKGGGRGGTLRVEATSTSATATLSAYRDAATTVTFVLTNLGGGRYEGSGSFSGSTPRTVTVRSNLGGSATAPVRRR